MIETLQMLHLTQMTAVKLLHFLHFIVVFSPINLNLIISSPINFQSQSIHSLSCSHAHWLTVMTLLNLLAIKTFFFFFFNKDHLALQLSPLPFLTPTGTERERGRSNSKLRGRALLSALHQETECERAARHHTEAPLKIHVYHSSSFIDGLSSLYVYEVRGLPVALVSDPWGPPWCPRNCLFPLIYPTFKWDQIMDTLPHI